MIHWEDEQEMKCRKNTAETQMKERTLEIKNKRRLKRSIGSALNSVRREGKKKILCTRFVTVEQIKEKSECSRNRDKGARDNTWVKI